MELLLITIDVLRLLEKNESANPTIVFELLNSLKGKNDQYVITLGKALYGLKQAGKE